MSKTTSSRSNSTVELFRFFAASAIVIYHWTQLSGADVSVLSGTVIAVEFFFMITGFYMMESISHMKTDPVLGESLFSTFKKAKKIYLPYLTALLLTFIVNIIQNPIANAEDIVSRLFHYKWEFFFLQMLGFNPNPTFGVDYLMGAGWYLSSMFIALVFAWHLARNHRKAYIGFIAPLSVIGIYCYILQTYGTFDVGNEVIGFTMLGNIRAFAGISLGALAWCVYDRIRSGELSEKGKNTAIILEIVGWAALASLPLYAAKMEPYNLAAWLIVLASMMIISSLQVTKIELFLDSHFSGLCAYLGRLSLYLYLFHWAIVMFLKNYVQSLSAAGGYILCFGIVLVISILAEKVFAQKKSR